MSLQYNLNDNDEITVNSDGIFDLWLQKYEDTEFNIELDAEIEKYNTQCALYDKNDFQINEHKPTIAHILRTKEWLIPNTYKNIDILEYCLNRCNDDAERYRVIMEFDLYKEKNMTEILNVLIYMVDTFKNKSILWGVGRGSSVSSFILYLIGIHRIHSLKYDLDIKEFLR